MSPQGQNYDNSLVRTLYTKYGQAKRRNIALVLTFLLTCRLERNYVKGNLETNNVNLLVLFFFSVQNKQKTYNI